MNILFLSHSGGYAGSTYSITYLARGLSERGHEVHLCTPESTILFRNLQKTKVRLHPLSFRAGSFISPHAVGEVARIVRDSRIQVINAQSSPDRYVSILAKWFYRLPAAVVHTRRQTPLSSGNFIQNFLYTRGTDRIVAVSRGVKEGLTAIGIPERHIEVIYNGTPAEKYRNIDPGLVASLRSRFGLSGEDIVIGCVSRPKQQDQLFHAMAGLDPNYKVLIVGPEREVFEERFGPIDIPQQVLFTGVLDNVTTLHCYMLMTMHVLPSTTEGLSQSLLEAMALGIPVIATRAAGNIDLIRDGVNGLFFEDADIGGLSRNIERVVRESGLRQSLIENGKKTALEDYSIERTISAYETFFAELIGNSASLPPPIPIESR